MKMMGEGVQRRVKHLLIACALVLLGASGFAQDGSIISVGTDSNRNFVLQWQSSSGSHLYVVQRESSLTPTSSWNDVTWTFGGSPTTTWTDTNAVGQAQEFYRVVRGNQTSLNNGLIPYGWAVTNDLDPLDPDLPWEYPEGDCLDVWQIYLQGSSATNPSPILITPGTLYAGSTSNTASVVPNLATLYSFGYEVAGMIQSGIDSNFYGSANTNNASVIFKMTPQWAVTTLYPFYTLNSITNGYQPSVPFLGGDGNLYGVCYWGGDPSHSSFCFGGTGFGTIFKLSTQGILTNLYIFEGPPNGENPVGLIQGTDGSFYGVTYLGGSNNCVVSDCCDGYGGYGTVFKLTQQGSFTTLHVFSGGTDGAWPDAALVQGTDGYLYGTTSGGNTNAGTVFKIGTNGTNFATLYPFSGGADGASPSASLIQDGGGLLYGTAFGGGTNNAGTVFSITTNGALTTLHTFSGSPDGFGPLAALVRGSDSNFYGTTVWGGITNTYADVTGPPPGDGIVFKMTPLGTLTTVYQFSGTTDGRNPEIGALVQSSFDGYLYGTTALGGVYDAGTVFKCGIPATYTWSVTGGSVTAGQGSAYISIMPSSVCPVTLSVAETNTLLDCSNSGSITITPTAPVPSANSPVTQGQSLTLSAAAVTGVTYEWSGPNGFTSTNQNPIISNAQPCNSGLYCLDLIGGGCTSLVSCVSVTVDALQPTASDPICAGQSLSLSISAIAGAAYGWSGPGGFSSTNQNPSISNVTVTGTNNYCVTVTANGCTSTSCVSVIVNPLPAAFVSGTTTTGPQCPVIIQAALTGTEPWTVTWSDGVIQSNVTDSPAERSVNPSTTTNYTVTALFDANCTGTNFSGVATIAVTTNLTTTTSVNVSNEVLVVYNTNVADSVSCANYYIAHRPGFSNANVMACSCTTTGTDGFETITTANLTNQIVKPIINFMLSNPAKSIKYVVLMYGMPSRVDDDTCGDTSQSPPSVQHHISRCLSDAGYTSGPYYEGSTCPFVATNYLGTTCLVTALNLATAADCTAYVNKVTSMYTGNVIISAKAAAYGNNNYYLDDTETAYGTNWFGPFQTAILAANPSASVTYSTNAVIRTGSNVKGYGSWGVHDGVFSNTYAVDGSVVWSGSSAWWLIETIESFNGQRCCSQGCVKEWFTTNAWGGVTYSNTPIGAVSYVEEPGLGGVSGSTYMSLWEEGFLFSECAWASKNTPCFQAIGDPLIKR
jgi:uncharacterized repeat protein (TIGR03803 family)